MLQSYICLLRADACESPSAQHTTLVTLISSANVAASTRSAQRRRLWPRSARARRCRPQAAQPPDSAQSWLCEFTQHSSCQRTPLRPAGGGRQRPSPGRSPVEQRCAFSKRAAGRPCAAAHLLLPWARAHAPAALAPAQYENIVRLLCGRPRRPQRPPRSPTRPPQRAPCWRTRRMSWTPTSTTSAACASCRRAPRAVSTSQRRSASCRHAPRPVPHRPHRPHRRRGWAGGALQRGALTVQLACAGCGLRGGSSWGVGQRGRVQAIRTAGI